MTRLLILSFIVFLSDISYAQHADFISIKKRNGVTIKSFYAGSSIVLETKSRMFIQGIIKKIVNDSLFVLWHDIRTVPTRFGVTMQDTVAAYVNKVHYDDIAWISINRKKAGFISLLKKMIVVGSSGYIILKTFNSVRDGQPLFEKNNLTEYGIALGVLGTTLLVSKLFDNSSSNRKEYKIIYTRL
ncbi:MAG: hypothetical protein WBC06_12370 [Chitinophagaceae bacterium]